MPTSSTYILTPVLSFVSWLQPRSVIDVGCGYGQWGLLLRQVLEHPWVLENRAARWATRLDGVEAWAGYGNPLWEFAYDRVTVGDGLSVMKAVSVGAYDLALCVEVIEHLPADAGWELLRVMQRAATHVLVSTPDRPLRQGAVAENPHEMHRTWWAWPALKRAGAVARLPASGSTVAVFSAQPESLRRWLRGLSLRTLGPLVSPGTRRAARALLQRLGLHPGEPAAGEGPPLEIVE